MGYMAAFGAPGRDDLLYEAVSEGRRYPGMEHWLPLFQERMDTLLDYLDGAPIAIEPREKTPRQSDFKQIADYYEARREAMEHPGGGVPYKPLPPERLYLTPDEWSNTIDAAPLVRPTPFAVPGRGRRCHRCTARGRGGVLPPNGQMPPSTFSNPWSVPRRPCRPRGRKSSSRCGAKAPASAWPACSGITSCST